jgi:Caspase domain
MGRRFWAVIIGNDDYPDSPLGGSVNDARLIQKHLTDYLEVPANHIRLLLNAKRSTIIDVLYDLRDDERIKPGDNILIYYAGHGSSFKYFTTPTSQAGCIEAICPVDRSNTVPDISDRELNSILSELGSAKGPNITVILDCCHSGGAVRSLDINSSVRFNYNKHGLSDREILELMFQAADNNPRRRSYVSTASETWTPDMSSFVGLAACQDHEVAEEYNVEMSNSVSRGMFGTSWASSQRLYGRFTWALVKALESEEGRTATYESIVTKLIGRLGPTQMPLAAGTRKASRLWFEDRAAATGYDLSNS